MRAAMTLALNQSEDCGGFLAALSLGLPLGPFSPSTRDSRVCRLLDECLALPVLRELGLLELCKKFLSFAKAAEMWVWLCFWRIFEGFREFRAVFWRVFHGF